MSHSLKKKLFSRRSTAGTSSRATRWDEQIRVNRALAKLPKSEAPLALLQSKKVFVGGIPNKASREELFALFARYGRLQDVSLPVKPSGENKGYAFVTFEQNEALAYLFADLRNVVLRAKPVSSAA